MTGAPGQGRFEASRAEALRRLEAFLPRAGRLYAERRNADLGPNDRSDVSVLSPYVRHRLIGEGEVAAAVLERHGTVAAEKFLQEVLWRTYWKGWLELRPAIWTRFLAERDAAREPLSGDRAAELAAAEAGETGIEGFDDWARELVATGYLHNHARMWFASIWIFTLRLPWTLGADFFLRHLLDADPASNTLSWRWVAGLQTAGKTYLATADNIARYSDGRFSPQGLATRADALREPPVPPARPLPPRERAPSKGPALLLVTGEDLHPESLVSEELAISTVLILRGTKGPCAWPFGDRATAFMRAAAQDTAERASERFGCPVALADAPDAEMILSAATVAKTEAIVTAYAPVGPIADALAEIAPWLAAAGHPITRLRREWDEGFWPFATKGYFAFRQAIPTAEDVWTRERREPKFRS